jgi:hypothetical protein
VGGSHLAVTSTPVLSLLQCETDEAQVVNDHKGGRKRMSILWIILIVILVLALLGFFSRGYW